MISHPLYLSFLKTLTDCAEECDHYSTECAGIEGMADCLKHLIDSAHICRLTASFVSRGSPFVEDITALCAYVCDSCANQCRALDNEDLRRSVDVCRRAAAECREFAAVPPPTSSD
jgi:hypothetical protein